MLYSAKQVLQVSYINAFLVNIDIKKGFVVQSSFLSQHALNVLMISIVSSLASFNNTFVVGFVVTFINFVLWCQDEFVYLIKMMLHHYYTSRWWLANVFKSILPLLGVQRYMFLKRGNFWNVAENTFWNAAIFTKFISLKSEVCMEADWSQI